MATRCTERIDLELSAERYLFELYFDPEFTRALYLEGLGFEAVDILEQSGEGESFRRRLKVRPRMNAPAPVRKVLGSTQEYVEAGHYDAAAKLWRYQVIPNTMADKLRIEGSQRVESTGDGRCRATFDIELEAKIFGVGKAIEKFMVGQYEESLRKQGPFTQRYIASRL